LTADSSEATGLKWAAPASGLTLINRTTFSASSGFDLDGIFTSTYENYRILIQATTSVNDVLIKGQGRYSGTTETGSVYYSAYAGTRVDADTINYIRSDGTTSWNMGRCRSNGADITTSVFDIYRVNGSGQLTANGLFTSYSPFIGFSGAAYIGQARTYDGFRLTTSSGTFTGQVSVYGLASA
jgi:hypothetical protein